MQYQVKIVHDVADDELEMEGVFDLKKKSIEMEDDALPLDKIKSNPNYNFSYGILCGEGKEEDLEIEFVVTIKNNQVVVSDEEVKNIQENIKTFKALKKTSKKP